MSKQYVKCLVGNLVGMSKGSVYKVTYGPTDQGDFETIDDDGYIAQWYLDEKSFELVEQPVKKRSVKPLTEYEQRYILDRPEDSSRSLTKQLWGVSSKRKSSINDFRKRVAGGQSKPTQRVKKQAEELRKESPDVPNTVPRKKPSIAKKQLDIYPIQTSLEVGSNVTHLMIPDTQVKPDIDMSYLSWIGEYIADKKPEVLVHIGDHTDFASLSSYDKGTKAIEGKRVHEDIDAAIEGMNLLLKPLYDLQQQEMKEFGEVLYKPKMVLTLGNHEERLMRHVNANPELSGLLSYDNLRYEEFGWEVYDYLEPAIVNGVTYIHYMPNPMTGKPYGGAALNILKNVGESFCMGHKQTLDVATRYLPSSGRQQWAIIAGAAYPHEEGYKGYTGNRHYRGIVVKHQVKNGTFNPMFVDLEYLKNRYEGLEE